MSANQADTEVEQFILKGTKALVKTALALGVRSQDQYGWAALLLYLAAEKVAEDARSRMTPAQHAEMLAIVEHTIADYRAHKEESSAIIARVVALPDGSG